MRISFAKNHLQVSSISLLTNILYFMADAHFLDLHQYCRNSNCDTALNFGTELIYFMFFNQSYFTLQMFARVNPKSLKGMEKFLCICKGCYIKKARSSNKEDRDTGTSMLDAIHNIE